MPRCLTAVCVRSMQLKSAFTTIEFACYSFLTAIVFCLFTKIKHTCHESTGLHLKPSLLLFNTSGCHISGWGQILRIQAFLLSLYRAHRSYFLAALSCILRYKYKTLENKNILLILILKHPCSNKRLRVHYYILSGAWKALKTFTEIWRRAENNLVTEPRHFNLHPRQEGLAEKFCVWPQGRGKANIWTIYEDECKMRVFLPFFFYHFSALIFNTVQLTWL